MCVVGEEVVICERGIEGWVLDLWVKIYNCWCLFVYGFVLGIRGEIEFGRVRVYCSIYVMYGWMFGSIRCVVSGRFKVIVIGL